MARSTWRAALIASLVAVTACRRNAARPDTQPDAGALEVGVAVAAGEERPVTLDLTGTLRGNQESEVTPLVAGRVTEVFVERGSRVADGARLVRLRTADFETAADNARAAVAQAASRLGLSPDEAPSEFDPEAVAEVRAAHANMTEAEDARRRDEALAKSGTISDQALVASRARADAARAQYEAALDAARGAYAALLGAKASYAQARRSITDATVRAPFAGEVAERRPNVGEYVTQQTPIVRLVQIDPLRVEVPVPQESVGRVSVGQPVTVRVDALPDRTFSGTVKYVGAAVDRESRSLPVEAIVPNADGALRPGVFARVELALPQNTTVVAVPEAAVQSTGDIHRVYVAQDGKAVARSVAIADRAKGRIFLSSGVSPGDRVIVTDVDRLRDGLAVAER